jgi:hypothetical protein
MIRYDELRNAWISGQNPDDQGMPTTNLSGDTKVCVCGECVNAYVNGLGANHADVHGES